MANRPFHPTIISHLQIILCGTPACQDQILRKVGYCSSSIFFFFLFLFLSCHILDGLGGRTCTFHFRPRVSRCHSSRCKLWDNASLSPSVLAPVASRTQPAACVYVLDRNSRPSPYVVSLNDSPVGVKPTSRIPMKCVECSVAGTYHRHHASKECTCELPIPPLPRVLDFVGRC